MEFENVYPCLTAHFTVDIHNDGEVPAAFNGIKYVYALKGPSPPIMGFNKYFPPSVIYDWGYFYEYFPEVTPDYYYEMCEGCDYVIDINQVGPYAWEIEVDPAIVPDPEPFPADKAHIALIYVELSAEPRDPEDLRFHPDAPDNSWIQIDPGYEVYAHVDIHFGEYLEQSTIYRFGWEMDFINWNELGNVPPAGPLWKVWGP
jgi:hypothetical protein